MHILEKNGVGGRWTLKKNAYFGKNWVGGCFYSDIRFFERLFRNFFPDPPCVGEQ